MLVEGKNAVHESNVKITSIGNNFSQEGQNEGEIFKMHPEFSYESLI